MHHNPPKIVDTFGAQDVDIQSVSMYRKANDPDSVGALQGSEHNMPYLAKEAMKCLP